MAKPNDNQKLLLRQLETFIRYLESTNDINSPSHSTIIEDLANGLDDDFTKKTFEAIAPSILIFTRKI